MLGWCSSSAGQAQYYVKEKDLFSNNDMKKGFEYMSNGYGFAAFTYILAFLLISGGETQVTILNLICG